MKQKPARLGKWKGLQKSGYRLVNLGRPAFFLLPAQKIRQVQKDGHTIEHHLNKFLLQHFRAFTISLIPSAGFWKDDGSQVIYDAMYSYEVSFVGKRRIPILLRKLAEIERLIEEDCIYFGAGQYRCLVYPPKKNAKRKRP